MSESSPHSGDRVAAAWRSHRPYLVNLAYQMLGDIGDAEDVAQEAFLRLARTDIEEIDDVRGWLTVVAGRLCLDQVRSARARRERPTDTVQEVASAREVDPADRVTLDDQVSGALLQVLSRLSPGERVAFVLHDVFEVPFDAIAETVGRPVGTCRQLARRARAKVASGQPRLQEVAPAENQLVTEAFITACANGDLQALAAVLDPSVWGVGTVLTDPALPPQINHGRHDVATNLLRYLGPGATLVAGPAGQPVLLAYAERRLFAMVVLTIRDGLVAKIEATADPVARFGADNTF
ncbi:RNA polymerase sigma factor SigI [Mycobacterium talmoniae]|uniref:Putative ECF RNA polymerase sigma factor SigI n=1 Tax=Mycobacterium talmoniae TaxID=1858794 RepID=A0A1S1MQH7_9MYCO|nr:MULTISPECIES: RNA polymerase sigma factor SigI [Mycobacterium]OHU88404.1 RNA polymerase subunit sigma [Mycobacterium talmoniae]PQM49744.1 putative ECF RNA polymerase sigma factor SigI [Mycobacterium talmoniae]TDH56521.1 RNA polymerase sigma factor SigI [Mycobacterium eburneum]